jgi:acetoin utilization protein AcuC
MQNYIFTSDIFKGSRYEKGHPLDMDRVWPSVELLKLTGWVNDNQIIKNGAASIEELILYHDKDYVEAARSRDKSIPS